MWRPGHKVQAAHLSPFLRSSSRKRPRRPPKPRRATMMSTERQNSANVNNEPSTSMGITRLSLTSDLDRRSLQIALEIGNSQDKSDKESDSHKPAVILHRNLDHIIHPDDPAEELHQVPSRNYPSKRRSGDSGRELE